MLLSAVTCGEYRNMPLGSWYESERRRVLRCSALGDAVWTFGDRTQDPGRVGIQQPHFPAPCSVYPCTQTCLLHTQKHTHIHTYTHTHTHTHIHTSHIHTSHIHTSHSNQFDHIAGCLMCMHTKPSGSHIEM